MSLKRIHLISNGFSNEESALVDSSSFCNSEEPFAHLDCLVLHMKLAMPSLLEQILMTKAQIILETKIEMNFHM